MDGVNEAVVKKLQNQKAGEAALPLWEEIWEAYVHNGAAGIDALLSGLLKPSDDGE